MIAVRNLVIFAAVVAVSFAAGTALALILGGAR